MNAMLGYSTLEAGHNSALVYEGGNILLVVMIKGHDVT